jgi:Cu2+-containing amine oxidase
MRFVCSYDYALDTVFYMDGTLENKAAASGYIQASFPSTWPSGDKEIGLFATRVRNGTCRSEADGLLL